MLDWTYFKRITLFKYLWLSMEKRAKLDLRSFAWKEKNFFVTSINVSYGPSRPRVVFFEYCYVLMSRYGSSGVYGRVM